ncbi:hypothetical protein [Actinoplanes sp. URMC 104]|uniref:hypothetical protein n=1 Tax=Actinoplanes sp. URMC 104 TaxID=3423409 RepID=UPI003F1A2493
MTTVTSWMRRTAMVAAGTAAVLGVVSTPALAADTLSTTGASGRWSYIKNGDWSLYAKDPLTDGHCAQWQYKAPGGSWTNSLNSVCSSTETWAGSARSGYQIRICRTGVWNCSGTRTL